VDCQPKAIVEVDFWDPAIVLSYSVSGLVASDHPDQPEQAKSPGPFSVKSKHVRLLHRARDSPHFANLLLNAN